MSRRVLWVSPVSNLAGVARHFIDAAREGIPGYELHVTAPGGPLLDELDQLGVPTYRAALDGNPIRAARTLRRAINHVRPEIVHSHLARADFLTTAATMGLPVQVVSTEHGIAADARLYNKGRLTSKAKRALHTMRLRRSDAIIAVSESTRDLIRRAWHPHHDPIVILNGVDRQESRQQAPGHRYLSLSRLAPEKRIEDAVRAFTALPEQATLTVAGDGPERDQLMSLVEELGLSDRVTFPGHVDSAKAFPEHDVLIQLSAWENASYSILDAVVHGLGVVATPVGGNPEILPDHCLTPADDQDRLRTLLTDQAADLDQRPTIPEGWPTVSEMTAQIAAVYDRLVR